MSEQISNSSFDSRPVRMELTSDRLLLIDPLALDGLAGDLAVLGSVERASFSSALAGLPGHLRIGVHVLEDFSPGTYELALDAFEAVANEEGDPEVFDIDTGTVVVIDLSLLAEVAKAFTWDKYDEMLQAPLGDDSGMDELNRDVGRAGFAIISADADTPFSGDGSFRIKQGHPIRVS
jgi:hypothetical protein